MPSESDIIRDYIRNEIGYRGEIDPEADLIDLKILDSFSVVELAMFVQTRFGVEFEPEELVRANLCSLNRLTALIDSKRKAA